MTTPFATVDEAWFWCIRALRARREGTSGGAAMSRPCDPDDIVKALDRLYRTRRIDLVHARILRIWGERGMVPDPSRPLERCDHRLWREALNRLEWPLRAKGIIAHAPTARAA